MTQIGNKNSPVPITGNQLQDGLVTTSKIAIGAVTEDKFSESAKQASNFIYDDSVTDFGLDPADLNVQKAFEALVEDGRVPPARLGSGTTDATTILHGDGAFKPLPEPLISQVFESTQQTITRGGSLTIAHGLGKVPEFIQSRLVCHSSDEGWSPGDFFTLSGTQISNNNLNNGAAVYWDATNIYVRYGDSSNVFLGFNKTTGVSSQFSNSAWRFVVRAFA